MVRLGRGAPIDNPLVFDIKTGLIGCALAKTNGVLAEAQIGKVLERPNPARPLHGSLGTMKVWMTAEARNLFCRSRLIPLFSHGYKTF
jgi:hypothetical protein